MFHRSGPLYPRLILAVTMAGTFIAAVLPAAEAPMISPSDKINHMIAFVVLTILAAWAYPRAHLFLLIAAMAAVGGAVELVQAIPFIGRDAEWADWRADVLAAGVTLIVVAVGRAARRAGARL